MKKVLNLTAARRHYLFQNEILTHFDFRKKSEILKSLLSQRFPRPQMKPQADSGDSPRYRLDAGIAAIFGRI
jgi:hypothetical protein